MSELKEFKKEYVKSGDRIILYGAAMYGELALNALQSIGLHAECFCDKVQGGTEFCKLPVIFPEELKQYENVHILICATKGFTGIVDFLQSNVTDNQKYYSVVDLLSYVDKSALRSYFEEMDIDELKDRYKFFVDGERDTGPIQLSFLGIVITEKCSLRCEKCSVMCPYIPNPRTMPLELIQRTISKVLSCTERILELQVGGGEPFLHKEMDKILDWCAEQEKIKEIMILTNATIMPNEAVVRALKNEKIRVILDDYGPLSRRLTELTEMFERENIRYVVQKLAAWEELGDIEDRGYSRRQTEELFSRCAWHNCLSIVYDTLFRCTRAAICDYLGKIPHDENDYINLLTDIEGEEFEKLFRDFLYNKKSHVACGYCNGISTHKATLPVAVQVK